MNAWTIDGVTSKHLTRVSQFSVGFTLNPSNRRYEISPFLSVEEDVFTQVTPVFFKVTPQKGQKDQAAHLDPPRPGAVVCVCARAHVRAWVPEHKAGYSTNNKNNKSRLPVTFRRTRRPPRQGCRQDCLVLFCLGLIGAVTDKVHLPVAACYKPGKLSIDALPGIHSGKELGSYSSNKGEYTRDKESQQLKTVTAHAGD